MSDDTKKIAVRLRQQLSTGTRHFIYSPEARDNNEKTLVYIEPDIKYMRFARDVMGAISDCYILFAVTCLGVADIDAIRMFLYTLKAHNGDLYIMDATNPDNVRARLKNLVGLGFLFKIVYTADTFDREGKPVRDNVSLYMIEPDGQKFMEQKLGKKTALHKWLVAKPMFELIGWASASYAACRVASAGKFIEFKQGVFQTKVSGITFIPPILKMRMRGGKDETHVGFFAAYFHHDTSIMTDNDYTDYCLRLFNVIKQYFFFNDQKKRYCRAVIVVEDNADLVELAEWFKKIDLLDNDLDRIFLIGEGILKLNEAFADKFITLKKKDTKMGYEFLPASPDFL